MKAAQIRHGNARRAQASTRSNRISRRGKVDQSPHASRGKPRRDRRGYWPQSRNSRKSRELRVAGPAVWGLVGVGVLVIGAVLLSVLTAIAGVAICVGAFFVSRRNRTESRLRSAFGKSGGS